MGVLTEVVDWFILRPLPTTLRGLPLTGPTPAPLPDTTCRKAVVHLRRLSILAAALVAAAAAGLQPAHAQVPVRPALSEHVILISVDGLTPGAIAAAGAAVAGVAGDD